MAEGVLAHSSVTANPLQRFLKTFRYVLAMTVGTREEAFRAANTVRRLHGAVHGNFGEAVGGFTPAMKYSAHHVDALTWVYTTLIESSVYSYELIVGPMSIEEKVRTYRAVFGETMGTCRVHKPAVTLELLGCPCVSVKGVQCLPTASACARALAGCADQPKTAVTAIRHPGRQGAVDMGGDAGVLPPDVGQHRRPCRGHRVPTAVW